MSAGKIVLVLGAVAAVGLVLANSANASPAGGLPEGWVNPEGSVHTSLPKGTMGLAFPVERVQWRQGGAGGATPGLWTMLSAGPSDWVVLFTADGTADMAPVQMGQGSNSKTIAKAAGVVGL